MPFPIFNCIATSYSFTVKTIEPYRIANNTICSDMIQGVRCVNPSTESLVISVEMSEE